MNNLRPDLYKVFALKDGNYNLLYDLPTEVIGFLDTALRVDAEFARSILVSSGKPDSAETDSLVGDPITAVPPPPGRDLTEEETGGTGADTTGLSADTLFQEGPDLNSIYIDLVLFTEASKIQYITDSRRDDRRRMEITFSLPVTDSFSYRKVPDAPENDSWLLEHLSSGRDTLTLWIRDSSDYKKDTLILQVSYTVRDTAGIFVTATDTLQFTYRERRTGRERGKAKEAAEEKLEISTIRSRGQQHLNSDLALNFNFPLTAFNDSLISLFYIPDSVEVPEPFRILPDSMSLTRAWISANWKSASKYRLFMLPGAIANLYNLPHDTLDVSFTTRDIEYYGQINLNLDSVRNRVIIQLMNREQVHLARVVESDGMVVFSYLTPQEYTIKFIHDMNGNGKWDTGDYLKHLQPEPVEFLGTSIMVRSNWEHEESMRLEK